MICSGVWGIIIIVKEQLSFNWNRTNFKGKRPLDEEYIKDYNIIGKNNTEMCKTNFFGYGHVSITTLSGYKHFKIERFSAKIISTFWS